MLGHSMGTLRLYELPREVQKFLGGPGGILPPKNLGILQPPRSVLRSYRSEDSRMRLVILWIYIAILRRSILVACTTCLGRA